jgi:hypothetical protein
MSPPTRRSGPTRQVGTAATSHTTENTVTQPNRRAALKSAIAGDLLERFIDWIAEHDMAQSLGLVFLEDLAEMDDDELGELGLARVLPSPLEDHLSAVRTTRRVARGAAR